ncbi:PmoA family protein [Blastopirellula sp. J2-11]|uniref:DUF6807 domain-containing protein n=1 Tax=Blastopirellula sp. J2-11 TaxID=2943192 RepID=UPI0021C5E3C7|nr:PmoA family protein [Blastopirellula sp. J2-11]UUO07096.1 PmoA family protein [Blastopirellula sp. J2-11]
MVRLPGKFLKNICGLHATPLVEQMGAAMLAPLFCGILLVATVQGDEAFLLENKSPSPISGILASAEVDALTVEPIVMLAGPQGDFPAQFVPNLDSTRRGRYYFLLPVVIPPNGEWNVREIKQAETPANVVTVEQEGAAIVVQVQGKEVLRYHLGLLPSPDLAQPEFGRSGFLHPMRTPLGTIVTDDFPPDHPHQHGVMFAWTDTTFAGRHVDFWNSGKKAGRVEHRELLRQFSGPVVGGFDVQLAHVDLTSGKPIDALLETWSVRVYASADPVLLEIESVQRTAGSTPLEIRKYHYGGMAVRGNRGWYQTDGSGFLTSEGKNRWEGNHSRPRWVDVFGPAEKSEIAGVTVMGSPDNFRFPQPVRLHPDKPYFCFSPQVEDAFTIQPSSSYRSRYLFIPHDGVIDRDRTETVWNSFAHPLTLKKAS